MFDEIVPIQEIDTLEKSQEKLNKDTKKIASKIVKQKDSNEVKDLIQLFNLNHTKKQVLRSMAADQLLDSIMDQAKKRVVERGDQFSNKDLLDYMNTMSNMIEKSHKQVGEIDAIPTIQLNQQNNITVMNNDGLDRESAQRVLEFVKNAMNSVKDFNESEEIFEPLESIENSTVQDDNIQFSNNEEDDSTSISMDNLFNSEDD